MSLLTLCSVIQSIGQKNHSSITKAQKTDFLTGILFDRCIKNVLANTCHFHSELQRAPIGSHKRTSGASRSLFLFRAGKKKARSSNRYANHQQLPTRLTQRSHSNCERAEFVCVCVQERKNKAPSPVLMTVSYTSCVACFNQQRFRLELFKDAWSVHLIVSSSLPGSRRWFSHSHQCQNGSNFPIEGTCW